MKSVFFYAQLNKKLAKSALYHIMHCFAFFPWFKGPFELPFSIKYTVGPLRSGIPNLVRIRTKVTKMVRNRSGIGHLTRSGFFWDAPGMTSTNVIMDRWIKYIYATTSFKVTNVCEQRAFLTGINVSCLIIFDCFLPFFTLLPLFYRFKRTKRLKVLKSSKCGPEKVWI